MVGIRQGTAGLELNLTTRPAPAAEIAFRARLDPATGTVWIGAWDTCRGLPTARRPELTLEDIDALPDDHAFGGWGLPLVAALAADCGVTRTPVGKWVYAVFPPGPR